MYYAGWKCVQRFLKKKKKKTASIQKQQTMLRRQAHVWALRPSDREHSGNIGEQGENVHQRWRLERQLGGGTV